MTNLITPRFRLLAAVVAILLFATACGSSSDEEAATTDTATDATAIAAEGLEAGTQADDQPSDPESSDDQPSDPDDGDAPSGAAESSDTSASTERIRLGDRMKVADLSATSGRFEGTITVAGGDDVPDGLELTFTGAFDPANDASEIQMDLGAVALAAAAQEGTDLGPMAALFEEPMIVRTIGTRSFVSWGLFSLLTGTEDTWLETEADEAGDITSSFGGTGNGSPVDVLAALEAANAEITELGTDDVRGVSTTHILAVGDLAELDETLTDDERATLERDLGDLQTSEFPMEFWIDDDGLIRRYAIDLSGLAQSESEFEQAGLVFEFYDYGADISIEMPPADQIISADEFDPEAFGFGD